MIPLNQALRASPVLASITDRIQQSQQMLATILPLVPQGLRAHLLAGPLDHAVWCLLVSNPSVASKLRQLSPALLAALRSAGFEVAQLRFKVHQQR